MRGWWMKGMFALLARAGTSRGPYAGWKGVWFGRLLVLAENYHLPESVRLPGRMFISRCAGTSLRIFFTAPRRCVRNQNLRYNLHSLPATARVLIGGLVLRFFILQECIEPGVNLPLQSD
jgi:hypothetical protein